MADTAKNRKKAAEMKPAEDEIDWAKHEERFQLAIDTHKKTGIHTEIFVCESGEACLVRKPTAKVSAMAIPLIYKDDYLGAGKLLIEECWIAGDDEIKKNEDLEAEVALAIAQSMNIKIASQKKNY